VGHGCSQDPRFPFRSSWDSTLLGQVAFDGDAVLFANTSVVVYKQQGLARFQEQEDASRHEPMPDGPY
jgi:hypothetical protein